MATETKVNDGGPAYPRHYGTSSWHDRQEQLWHGGMSLRDYFAAKAMIALAHSGTISQDSAYEDDAQRCYLMADAMLKARQS